MPSLTLDGIRQMHRAFAFNVILGPDWAEDERGNPKFLTQKREVNKRVDDPYKSVKDKLRARGVPEERIETELAAMIKRRQELYKAAGVKRKV